jgi:PPOX class probable F420-dependent enzyme
MDIPDSHRDLLDAEVATLATNGPDGRPQVSEVWFLYRDETVALSLNTSRQKVKNLQRDPVATLFILDPSSSYRYLEIRGDAVITPDDDYDFADAVGAKYHSDLRVHDGPGDRRVMVTLTPVTVNAVDMRS